MPGSPRCRCTAGAGRVDLLVPVKELSRAKARLRGAADAGARDRAAHAELVLAMLSDTLQAALAADAVRRVLVVTSDPAVAALGAGHGAQVLRDLGHDLNSALCEASRVLRERDACTVLGALHGDLPSLAPGELSAALRAAGGRRSYCPDREGTGTTLLLSAHAAPLHPNFGSGSARRHADGGAVALSGPWPSLACDVDTPADLARAAEAGLGPATRAVVCGAPGARVPSRASCR